MAWRTRKRSSSLTKRVSLTTCDTVLVETPARSASSPSGRTGAGGCCAETREICERYPVDGFWYDITNGPVCYYHPAYDLDTTELRRRGHDHALAGQQGGHQVAQ